MLTGIRGDIEQGYTGYDHLIDSGDQDAVMSAVAGRSFRRSADALNAAVSAYLDSCDRRVTTARITVELRTSRGDLITVG